MTVGGFAAQESTVRLRPSGAVLNTTAVSHRLTTVRESPPVSRGLAVRLAVEIASLTTDEKVPLVSTKLAVDWQLDAHSGSARWV